MKSIIAFLLFYSCLYAQINPTVPDFLISGEDKSPSVLKQQYPLLTKVNGENFLVTWYDRRDGASYYAQKFDKYGNKIGENFKVVGPLAFSNNDYSVLSINTENSWSFYYDYFNIYAQLLDPENKEIQNTSLLQGFYPDCATGYISGEDLVAASANSYYYLNNEGGSITSLRIKNDGTIKRYENNQFFSVTRAAVTASSNSDFIYAWIKGDPSYEDDPDNFTPGIYLTVINSEDSIVIPNLLVSYLYDESDYWDYVGFYSMNVTALNDSLFKIFWIKNNKAKLFSTVFNLNTRSVCEIDSLDIPEESEIPALKDFLATNKNDNGFYIKLIYSTDYENSKQFLVKYDSGGYKTGDILCKSDMPYQRNKNEFFTPEGYLFTVTSNNNDIYLVKKSQFDSLSAVLINDDESGSEEKNYSIDVVNDNEILSTWNNGSNYYGTTIKTNGELGSRILLPEGGLKHFKDGQALSLWINKVADYYAAGYTIYDDSYNKIFSKTLAECSSSDGLSITAEILSDSTFIVALGKLGKFTLLKESVSGGTIKSVELSFTQTSPPRIYNADEGFLWVQGDGKFLKYSYDINFLQETTFNNYSGIFYIGRDRFITATTTYNYYYQYFGIAEGTIFNANKDTLVSGIRLGYFPPGQINFLINSLNNGRFIFINKYNNNYYGRTFNNDGVAYADSFKINHSSDNEISDIRCIQKGNKVYFTWSEARTPGKSLDIYGNIFDVDKITSVEGAVTDRPTSYRLEQNYPNPFNPATNINYHVAEPGLVTLKVYDLLGNEVATLVNEEKSTGVYKVSFDGSNLASGIYFCRMNVNSYTETMKMMLVK